MNLKVIEHILDSIDPYQIAKDTGFSITSTSVKNSEAATDQAFFIKYQHTNDLRIFNSSFVNLETFSADYKNAQYFAGSGIDFLAYYYKGNYDKAFNAFFELYAQTLKKKLIHEPKFIKSLIKDRFIKRHEILNTILKHCFDFTSGEHTTLTKSISWLNKLGISNLKQIRGTLFGIKSRDLHILLHFLLDPKYISFQQLEDALNCKDTGQELIKLISLKPYLPELELYRNFTTDEWIVIPYFSNFYKISALHIINPVTDEVHKLNLDDSKVSYAGLYALNCKTIDLLNNKIRFLESEKDVLTLINKSRQFLTNDKFNYLAINLNINGLAVNTLAISNSLFLYKPNSSLTMIKLLKDLYPNFYICDFANWEESDIVYTWENFLVREFKELVTKNKCLSPEVEIFLNIADFQNTGVKNLIKKWLKENQYKDIYQRLNSLTTEEYDFRTYSITATANGYILHDKRANKLGEIISANNESILTNFIIKVDKNILFKNKDDIMHKGRIIMGEDEYPVTFFKSELRKKNILETIALRGFTNFNTADSLLDTFDQTAAAPQLIPSLLEPNYHGALITILNKEIIKVPCTQGYETIGWDKINNAFAMPIWAANSLLLKKQPQYFLQQTALDSIYDHIMPKTIDYKHDLKFLNKQIKDMLSIILSYLYRTYLSYPVAPIFIKDSKTARNLIKFIFAAFGQYRAFNLDPNKRVIKSGKIFEQFNKVPLYLRSDDSEILKEVKNVPFFLFCRADLAFNEEDKFKPYVLTFDLRNDDYFKVTKFTMDTLERFFKWLFNIKLDEFDFDKTECESCQQLIREGERIFNLIWWDSIIEACTKNSNASYELREFLSMLTDKEFYRYFAYHEERQEYILRRLAIKDPEHQLRAITLFKALSLESYARKEDNFNYASCFYDYINKDIFEKCAAQTINIEGHELDVKTLRLYTDPRVVNNRTLRFLKPSSTENQIG